MILALHKEMFADREWLYDEPSIVTHWYEISEDGSSARIPLEQGEELRKAGYPCNVHLTETCEGEEWSSGTPLKGFLGQLYAVHVDGEIQPRGIVANSIEDACLVAGGNVIFAKKVGGQEC